jgi:hypothetical protein
MKLSRGSFDFLHIKVIWLLALGKQSVHVNATVQLENAAHGATYLVVVEVRSGIQSVPWITMDWPVISRSFFRPSSKTDLVLCAASYLITRLMLCGSRGGFNGSGSGTDNLIVCMTVFANTMVIVDGREFG